ncbi:hypothetical protein ABEG17_08420 [Pedococcus sp. KACC 23699]|uniref:Uncharacterized protein n=1 Tax=Pedococcus sp. KACC 23699 TaxID=3149228 RepID=A0AAU7JYM7_9MICO
MTFPIMTLQSRTHSTDDTLFPLLASPGGSRVTQLSRTDGHELSFLCGGVSVTRIRAGIREQILKVTEVRVCVDITDERVVIGCENYDKGGGWWGVGGGGAAFAVVANIVSKVRAANRSRGIAMVGQVRHPWLQEVVATPAQGFFGQGAVGLAVQETAADGGALVVVSLALPKEVSASLVAQAITTRAAAWRLANDRGLDGPAREAMENLAAVSRPSATTSVTYKFPSAYPVSATSARGPVGQTPAVDAGEPKETVQS